MKHFRYSVLGLVGVALCLCGCENKSNSDNEQPYEIDYVNTNNWLKIPAVEQAVDVFYLYPTCWEPTETDGLVNTIDNASMRAKALGVYAEQASCFEGVANVFAPYYRQLNAMKLLNYSLEEQEQLVADVPYHDALAAFEYYLKHYNNGRPFILAGHSQGSNVIKILLSDYMAKHPEVYELNLPSSIRSQFHETTTFVSVSPSANFKWVYFAKYSLA